MLNESQLVESKKEEPQLAENKKEELQLVESKKEDPISILFKINQESQKSFKPKPYAEVHLGRVCPLDSLSIFDKQKEYELFIPYSDRKQHFGCVGTTGTGKTRLMMYLLTQDILNGCSVLVMDPKYDDALFSRVIEAATLTGRLDEVIYFNPILPQFSTKLNLLYLYYVPDEIVDHVVAGVRAKEEYFENVAYEVTLSIVLGLYALAKSKGEKLNITFHEIKKWCSHEKLGELQRNLEYLQHYSDEEIKRTATDVILFIEQIRSSPADFFAKVSSSLRTVLTSLSASVVGDLIGKASYNEFLQRLESGKRVIMYCNTGSLLIRKSAHVLGRIIMSMLQGLIGRIYAAGKKIDPPLMVYLDEGQNVLYRGIDEIFAKGRAANVCVHFFTQSFASISSMIGEELGTVIIDNISTWVYMRVNCEHTASKIVKSIPKIQHFDKKFIPGGEGATLILGENKSEYQEITKIMGMPDRRFIIKTVDGKYFMGNTPFTPDPKIKIRIPRHLFNVREEIEILATN